MERFISAKFFRLLREASQKGIDTDAQVLKKEFAGFAQSVFSEGAAATDRRAYLDSLVYTRVELSGLTEVSEKKIRQFMSSKPLICLTGKSSGQKSSCWRNRML
jgi:hypothetical protein